MTIGCGRCSSWLVPLRWPERRPRRLALEGLLTTAVAQILAVLVLGMWSRERLTQPLDARVDAVLHAGFIRSMQLTGWYSAGAGAGAPNGQDMVDFPLGPDHVHLVVLRLLAELPISAFSVLNLYFLASFGVVAGVTHLTLRSLGSDALPAAAGALLYAFLPYHFAHGPGHLFLSMYVSIPLAILLAVWVADGRLGRRTPRWRWAVAAVCVLVVGSASGYYAVFGAICVMGAACVGAFRRDAVRTLLIGLAVAAAIGVVLVANVTPNLLDRRANGDNIEVAHRSPRENDFYGLRPATLVVPSETHRIEALARLGREANDVPFPGERGSYLGFVGVLGFGVLLATCFAGLAARKVPPVLASLAGMLVVSLLVGARGGGGYLISLAGFTNTRAWGRMSLVIALLSLGAMSLVATAATRRFGLKVVTPAMAVLVVLGLLDQIPAEPVPNRATVAREVDLERALVQEMEATLPAGAMVYQLPYHRFPEAGPRDRMLDYDQLRPYVLGGGRLRWSGGGLKGREADWQELWAAQPVSVLIRAVAAAGFSALWVDRRAYGDDADQLLAELTALSGSAPRTSGDGMLAWMDLRPYRERVVADLGAAAEEVGRAVTSSPRAIWERGFGFISGPPPGVRPVRDGAVLELRAFNGRQQAVALLLSMDLPPGVTVAVEAGQDSWRSTGAGSQSGRLSLELGDDPTRVRFALDGTESLPMTVTPVDAGALRLLPEPAAPAAAP